MLARVIGAAPGRIAAVVRRNHEEVVIVEPLTKFGQPAVELLKRERVPSGVAPVAVNRVEVDKIGEQQTTIRVKDGQKIVIGGLIRDEEISNIQRVPFLSRLAGTVSYGYAHGNAGIAAFLFAVAAASGEAEFAAVATEALLTVLPRAVSIDGAAYWPASPDDAGESSEAGYWPSWCNGSSGMGTAFLRAHVATGDPTLRLAAEAAAKAGLRERWRSTAGQCHGLAGDAELLLDLAALPAGEPPARGTGGVPPTAAAEAAKDSPYRRAAIAAADALLLQRRTPAGAPGPGARGVPGGTVFADDSGATVSAGFGTGLAGTGSFLLRLVAGGPRPLMLDQLLAAPRGEER